MESTGSDVLGALGALEAPLERVRAWAGSGLRALLVSGSHASGEAVWIRLGERTVSLSDIDVYAIIASRAERDAAESRARGARADLGAWLLERNFAGPLEVAFHTPRDLERLPARPGTLELKRHARVLTGESGWLERIPAFRPCDVPAEEVDLLLENRAFELLLAHPGIDAGDALERLRSRHAVLKTALDLAAVAALAAGEFPDGAAARVAWARTHGVPGAWYADLPAVLAHEAKPDELDRIWSAALEWRSGGAAEIGPARAYAEWHSTVRAWCAAWWARTAAEAGESAAGPYRRALRFAARARLRRRVRAALFFRSRSGAGPGLGDRLARALRGTPRHRVNGSATVLLLAAASDGTAALPARAVAALETLGIGGRGPRGWAEASRRVAHVWDAWLLEGQRTAGMP